MAVMKTPGVYIVEKNAFPNSIVEVATAVPAFIGYTERADNKGKSLTRKPMRISSISEYQQYFGFGPTPQFDILDQTTPPVSPAFATAGKDYLLKPASGVAGGRYLLYYSILLFFQNGGGPCYIVSVGNYGTEVVSGDDASGLISGIAPLVKEQEPTMVVIPDAVLLEDKAACISVQQAMLKHCGEQRNRVAILDIWGGYRDRQDNTGDCVDDFRNSLGINYLSFGTAYYPWVNTTIVQENELDYTAIHNRDKLVELLKSDIGMKDLDPAAQNMPLKVRQQLEALADVTKSDAEWAQKLAAPAAGAGGAAGTAGTSATGGAQGAAGTPGVAGAQGATSAPGAAGTAGAAAAAPSPAVIDADTKLAIATHKGLLTSSLRAMSPLFKTILDGVRQQLNLLPPSAAMAGIYTMVDATRGVWKAPANVSLNSVVSPAVSISHAEQEDLNVTTQGKSINAIRSFIGEGVLVWGARTLDGNSLDWRYINVRRTLIMLEESCRLAAKALVFEPNVSSTWVTIKSMISNFLTGIWKRGGLAGAVPDDAFSVHVGLGETMTPDDILEGIMRITVLVAVSRPAEFIEITFQQQMQKS
jgi:phage tail sheath protein FI